MRSQGSRFVAVAALLAFVFVGLQASATPPAQAAFPGENGLIVFESDRTEKAGEHINLIRLDGEGRMRRIDDLGRGYSAAPSPDGAMVGFFRHEGPDCFVLYVMGMDGSGLRQIEKGCDLQTSAPIWSPDGRKLAFGRYGGLSIADLSQTSIRTIPDAFGVSWSPNGRTLVFGRESPRGSLFQLRLDVESEPVRLPIRGLAPQWSPDGELIAFHEYRDELGGRVVVARPDGTGHRVLTRAGVGAFAWSPGGRRIAFIRRPVPSGSSSLYVVNRDGTGRRRLASSFPLEPPLTWSPDGRFVAVATQSARVYLARVDRGARRRFGLGWPPHLSNGPLAWTGRRSLLLSTRVGGNDRDLYAVEPDGSGVTALTTNTAADFDAAGSPDGTRIAFVSNPRGPKAGALFVMNLRDRSVRRISRRGNAPRSPTWSPDGRRIAYVSNPHSTIQVVELETGKARRVARGEDPAWSPDGTEIAYALDEIYVVRADGRNQRRLTDNPYLDRAPSWAPDGRRLAFTTRLQDRGELFIALVNRDGSGLRTLPVPGRNPAWSPDGGEIVFDRFRLLARIRVDDGGPVPVTSFGDRWAPTRAEQNPDWLPRR
jgi:Tol biopolymer transport system component